MSVSEVTPHDHTIRVISIYATRWRYKEQLDSKQHLSLGRLEEFYSLFRGQLPQVLRRQQHTVKALTFGQPDGSVAAPGAGAASAAPPAGPVQIKQARSWLFVLPSDQVVAVLDFDFVSDPLDIDHATTSVVLEHCAYAQLYVDGADLENHIAALAEAAGAEEIDANKEVLPPERHQVVFAPYVEGGQLPDENTLKRILFRVDPPNRPEFMKIRRPPGLNEAERTLGAVTPYVSLLYGHQEYIENSIFLTAVQAVGTTARFRQIWHKAHRQVRDFRYSVQNPDVGKQRRADMEFLVDELGNLELDLSFSVETSSDLGLLIPSLRLESFHKELYAAMELQERAETVSRMFTRLDAVSGRS